MNLFFQILSEQRNCLSQFILRIYHFYISASFTTGEKIIETIDNSDKQLLFNDIFLVKFHNKKYLDFDVSEYGLFYNLCFQGFDDCLSNDDEEEVQKDDDNSSLNGFIVNDEESVDSDYELDEDYNEY